MIAPSLPFFFVFFPLSMSMSIAIAIAIAALFLFRLFLFYFVLPWSSRKALVSQGFHVLPYIPFTGDLPNLRRLERLSQRSPLPSPSSHHLLFPYLYPFFHNHFSAHGDEAPLVFWWGTRPTVVITHPDDAKCALSADGKHFVRSETTRLLRQVVGNGLLLLDGGDWHRHRNMMRPAFFTDRLKAMVGHMKTSAMEMIGEWERQVAMADGGSAEIEVAKPIKDTTADILSRSLFGTSYLQGKAVFDMQVELLEIVVRLRVENSVIPGYRFLPTKDNLRTAVLEKKMNLELRKLVESRLSKVRGDGAGQKAGEPDLLELIVAAEAEATSKHSEFATQRIIDECKTFFFAGHETTAILLSWAMVLLSVHEEWQERGRREVMEMCGRSGERLQPETLSRLKIIGMVINETLRLYPPAAEFGRRIMNPEDEAFQLGSRTLPKGTTVVVECLYIHRRKDIWGEDADEFNPERFANGVGNACKHPYGFIPFGIGPRHCIGQHFAILEAKVILSLILTRFSFRLSPTYVHAPVTTSTMRPKHGVHLILQPLSM